MQLDDDILLLSGDVASLQVCFQVVHPPQPATLPAPQQTYGHPKKDENTTRQADSLSWFLVILGLIVHQRTTVELRSRILVFLFHKNKKGLLLVCISIVRLLRVSLLAMLYHLQRSFFLT